MLLSKEKLSTFLKYRVTHGFLTRELTEKINELLYNYFSTGENKFTKAVFRELALSESFSRPIHGELLVFINDVITETVEEEKEVVIEWPSWAKYAWKRSDGVYDYFKEHPKDNQSIRGRIYIGKLIERFPLKKEINWPEGTTWRWYAIDKNGKEYFYTHRPEPGSDMWPCMEGSWFYVGQIEPFDDDGWKYTLTRRP